MRNRASTAWVGALVVLLLSLTGAAAAFTGLSADGRGGATAAASQPCANVPDDNVLHTGVPEPQPCDPDTSTVEPTTTPTHPEPTGTGTDADPTVRPSEPQPTDTEARPTGDPTEVTEPTAPEAEPTATAVPTPTAAEPSATIDAPTPTDAAPTATTDAPTLTDGALQPLVLELSLATSAASNPVGSDLTVTATIVDDGAPVEGASVRLLGQLAGEDDIDITLDSGPDGVAAFTHTRGTSGTETLTVTASWEGQEATATDSVIWVEPEGEREIEISPVGGTATVGDTAEFVATVTHGGLPVAGADISFLAGGGGYLPVGLDGVTGPDGTVTFEHSRSAAGVEQVTVILEPVEDEIFADTTFTWMAPPTLVEIAPSTPSSLVGETVTFVVTATQGGEPLADENITFSASLPGEESVWLDGFTGPDGTVTFEHRRDVAGADEISVYSYPSGAFAEMSFTWWPHGPAVQIIPPAAGGLVGEPVEIVATVLTDGQPVPDEPVQFTASIPGADDVSLSGTTDADGRVVFEHVRDVTGTDTLRAEALGVTDQATYTWYPPGLAIRIDPQGSSAQPGAEVEFRVTVTQDGEPVVGANVGFLAVMDGDDDVTLDGTTGADGVARFWHSRGFYGVDEITVSTSVEETTASAQTEFTWRGPLAVTLSPESGSADTGTSVEWTVTVDEGDTASFPAAIGPAWREGVSLHVVATQAGAPDVEFVLTPDDEGVATFTHTRTTPGEESLLVEATVGEETATATGSFLWLPESLQIEIEPLGSSGQPGTTAEFAATVTADGQPLAGVSVDFLAVLRGTENEVALDGTTGPDGVARFLHSREQYGIDDVTVSTSLGEVSASAQTEFTWRGALEVSLSPESGSAVVGTPVEWTVTVSEEEPIIIDAVPGTVAPAWHEGVDVRFVARMDGQPDVELTVNADEEGVATFSHTRLVPGTETIEVFATVGEETATASGSFLWAPETLEIEVEPLASSATPGTTVEFAATVTADGEPVAGAPVYLSATLQGTENSVFLEGTTGTDGVARFEHTRDVYGVDDVMVTTVAYDLDASAETVFTWRRPLAVTLSAGTGSADVGTPVVVTVTVGESDPGPAGVEATARGGAALAPTAMVPAWVEEVEIRFLAQLPGEPDVDVTLVPDAEGVATYTHTRSTPGTESLLVEATVGEETVAATGSFVWEVPLALTLAPLDGSGPIGEPVEFAASLTADGSPVAGETVNFRATLEETEDSVFLSAETGADGVARFSHVRNVLGVDLIEVWVEDADDVFAETTFTWEPPPPVLTLSQSATSGEVGTPLELTATLTSGDDPIGGTGVRLLAQLPGEPDIDVTVVTGADGVATFTHTRTAPGTESLTVGATVGDETVFAAGSFEWVVPPVVQLTVQPVDASGPVGSTVDFVATLTADGKPLPDHSVTFTAAMAGAPTVAVSAQTDADGTAHFAHTRSVAGEDGITVEAVALDQEVSAKTTFTWQPPPPPTLTLSQSGTTGVVGTTLEWTATVTSGGEPVAGATVRFLAQKPGAGDVDVTRTTNAAGVATHTHTRTTPGSESLQVTTTVAGTDLSATGSFTWMPVVPPTTPPDPSPTTPPTAPPTTPPVVTPTTPPVVTTPPVTPTGPPTTPATPTTPVTPTESPTTETTDPGPTTDPPTTPPPAAGQTTTVELGRNSAIPGGDLEVSGTGCEPGSTVVISLAGQTLGTTTADATGAFSVRAAVANMPLGQYAVDVQCGNGTGQAMVNLVSTVESSTAVASAASAAAVLTFFVLLGTGVLKQVTGGVG